MTVKKQNDSGQAMVEFALTLWIFLLIIFFIIDFGWVAYQRTSFEYGYIHSSWAISADDLGDKDPLDEDPSEASYSGTLVSDALSDELDERSPGIIAANMTITNAKAELYNKPETYKVPGRTGDAIEAVSRTRYMDLSADFSYVIRPITPIGKMFFKEEITVEKELERTRVVRTQHRSE